MHGLCLTGHVNGNRERRTASQNGSRGFSALPLRLVALIALLFCGFGAGAESPSPLVTLVTLRNDPNLTPERFGQYFRDFDFKLGAVRQAPESFLAAKAGDCDDFACLAAEVLREKHYTTKLVAVFMQGQTHVVCYVDEIHGYLDYNLRKEASAVQGASGKLEEIADKVAAYFRTPWRSASEFNYEANQPRFGRIIFASARSGSRPEPRPGPPVQQSASYPHTRQVLATIVTQGL
jgi:hypothetical protein